MPVQEPPARCERPRRSQRADLRTCAGPGLPTSSELRKQPAARDLVPVGVEFGDPGGGPMSLVGVSGKDVDRAEELDVAKDATPVAAVDVGGPRVGIPAAA